jgi:hypothetical protein
MYFINYKFKVFLEHSITLTYYCIMKESELLMMKNGLQNRLQTI